jgi:hypothetical protein
MTNQQTISPDSLCISRILPFYGCHRDDGLFTFGDNMKKCSKCGIEKDSSDFHKNKRSADGLQGWCSACMKSYGKRYHHENREKISTRKRVYTIKNKSRIAKRMKLYNQTQRGKEVIHECTKRYVQNHPEKRKATRAINHAIERGEINSEPCLLCGSMRMLQAHHPDYSKPLDVVWLCKVCHNDLHKKERGVGKYANN